VSKSKKLLESIRRNPRNVPLQEFETLINRFGYIEEGGKHPKAIIGVYTMPYKRENPVKSCYVTELMEILTNQKT
jgi:hypothetical protein